MNEKYLVVNCGSSSLKFSLYEMPQEKELINGYIEKIGKPDSFWTIKVNGVKKSEQKFLANHEEAAKVMLEELIKNKTITSLKEIKGVGHRVLHGGEKYKNSVKIDDEVLENIINLTNLGPLHHPGEIAGIKAIQEVMPNAIQVAVFDTAFHQTMPPENYIYAVPYEWYTNYKIRRYGFHGTSHKYITKYIQNKLEKDNVNLIICHVGSGASISCIKNGQCLATTMGLTPLDGLVMGTRSGAIDPSIIKFLADERNLNIDFITEQLNKNSGLSGICGKNDFRDLLKLKEAGDERAQLAYNIFRDSIVKYIAEYYFKLESQVDAIIFTAGVLENNPILRADIINCISKSTNIFLNETTNNNIGAGHELKEGIITTENSQIPIYVIPTNEEIMIARDTYEITNKK